MRIIGGTHKGHPINPPSGFKARPTTDFAREALFNVLQAMVNFEESSALDLFSGSGAISYELASRGTKEITVVEQEFRHAFFIKAMAKQLNMAHIKVIRSDVFSFLKKNAGTFDFVFADPPYELSKLETIPDLVLNSNTLAENGIFVLEHSKMHNFATHNQFVEHRRYGHVNFSFFKR